MVLFEVWALWVGIGQCLELVVLKMLSLETGKANFARHASSCLSSWCCRTMQGFAYLGVFWGWFRVGGGSG